MPGDDHGCETGCECIITNASSTEMALRIEKVFGVSMKTLTRMQNSHDIAQTRKREGEADLAPFETQVA